MLSPVSTRGGSSLRVPMSYDEFRTLGETKHHEYYDGLCVVNPPTKRHVLVARRLTRALEDAAPAGYDVLPEWGWHLEPAQDYEPDIMVAPSDTDPDVLRQPPLLVVEVTSPSTRHEDWGHKRRAYAAGGAEWYWIVGIDDHEIAILRRHEGEFVIANRLRARRHRVTEPFDVTLDVDHLLGSSG
jgi:Uma2 family endonuclease